RGFPRLLHRGERAPAARGAYDRRADQFHDGRGGGHEQRGDAQGIGASVGAVAKEGARRVKMGTHTIFARRTVWRGMVCVPALLAVACIAQAQTYPAKPVRIVVPTSAGGGNDFVARLAGQRLGDRLGQTFIVENRPGAGGATATAQVARAAPDGYTLLLGFVGQLAMRPHVEQVAYDARRDFTGISMLASGYQMLAVHPSLPVRSVK